MANFCPNCGKPTGGDFCEECGYSITVGDILPQRKQQIYDMMDSASADDMSYINGSGAMNVKDGQYNSTGIQDNSAVYTRNSPAPYITKDSSLQDDIANFYAERAGRKPDINTSGNTPVSQKAPYITQNSSLQDDIANFYASRSAGADASSPNNNANPYAGANIPASSGNPYAKTKTPAPYITKESKLEDDMRNFYAHSSSGSMNSPADNDIFGSFGKNDPYEGLYGSDRLLKMIVEFIKWHLWQFIVLLLIPTAGMLIGIVYGALSRHSAKRTEYIVYAIIFVFGGLMLKMSGFTAIGGLDEKFSYYFLKIMGRG